VTPSAHPMMSRKYGLSIEEQLREPRAPFPEAKALGQHLPDAGRVRTCSDLSNYGRRRLFLLPWPERRFSALSTWRDHLPTQHSARG
jgi:hypothetical protein